MNAFQRAVSRRLPDNGDKLPVCGHFYRGRGWLAGAPLESVYPRWFVMCCRVEVAIYMLLYRVCGRKF